MKKLTVNNTTTYHNKSVTKHIAIGQRKKQKEKQKQTQISVEEIILLEKKNQIWGRNYERGDFRSKIAKKITMSNEKKLERENRMWG